MYQKHKVAQTRFRCANHNLVINKLLQTHEGEDTICKYCHKINKRPPGLIAPLLRFWYLLGNPPKNTTKGRDLIFNEGIGC